MGDLQYTLKNQVSDESYLQGMAEQISLYLLVDNNRLQYTLVDDGRQKAVVMRDFHLLSEQTSEKIFVPGFFSRVFAEDDLLNQVQPKRVILSVYSPVQSLVPAPLFSRDTLRETLSLTNIPGEKDEVYSDSIVSANAHLLFSIPSSLSDEICRYFPGAMIFHASSSFIENQLRLHKHESETRIAVVFRRKHIDMVITQGNELRFFNIFETESIEDFMYYLLFCMEQLQLNPDQTPVTCYGEIEKINANWLLGRKYIRNFEFGDKVDGVQLSYGFDTYSAHQYYPLFIQRLCVS